MKYFLRRFLYKLLYDDTLYKKALVVTNSARTLKKLYLSKSLITQFEKTVNYYGHPTELKVKLDYLKKLWGFRFKLWKQA